VAKLNKVSLSLHVLIYGNFQCYHSCHAWLFNTSGSAVTQPSKFEHHGAWPATATSAMVASADKHATAAGVAVLREGGNVVDATLQRPLRCA